jgi:tetratricopeptide (TPR) repeat protein/predicted Ser/Thr protein kinase
MTPEQYSQIEALFLDVCDLPKAERGSYLDRQCGDPQVRSAVEHMLSKDDEPVSYMDRPVRPEADEATSLLPTFGQGSLPDKIDRYHILELIGSGGMGDVYLAEQRNPRRTVALKVIRGGLGGKERLARFEREAHVLGRLHHPGIAQVYDAGTSESGQPFFAMEHIAGQSLLQYATVSGHTTEQRLELIAKVCDAAQHAHDRGVIHRDLKPGNILVLDSGQPKILDFGVARATDSDVKMVTIETDAGQLIGTIPYMSPEQIAADPDQLDHRSDVYAIGVLLYELLAGKLPYDVQRKMIHDAARVIREDDPTPLSSIDRVYSGDVDTIVTKALEKDKARRYQSAADLASDIRRFLRHEPITARPVSAMYQLRKFARRNTGLVSGVAAIFVILTAGVIFSTTHYLRSEAARKRAVVAQGQTETINAFLRGMLEKADRNNTDGRELTMREVLDMAAADIGEATAGMPEVEASIRGTIGQTYLQLGHYQAAETHFGRVLTLVGESGGDDQVDATVDVANALRRQGEYGKAIGLLEDLLSELGEDEPSPLYARIYHELGHNHMALGQFDEANQRFTRASQIHGEGAVDVLSAELLASRAAVMRRMGQVVEAEPLLRSALTMYESIQGPRGAGTTSIMNNLAVNLSAQGRHEESQEMYREVLATIVPLRGEKHPRVLLAQFNLATELTRAGLDDEAEPLLRKTLALHREVLGSQHEGVAFASARLASLMAKKGQFDESAALFKDAIRILKAAFGSHHPMVGTTLLSLAQAQRQARDYSAADVSVRQAISIYVESVGRDHVYYGIGQTSLAVTLRLQGRFEEADVAIADALRVYRLSTEDNEPGMLDVWTERAQIAAAHEDWPEALQRAEVALQHINSNPADNAKMRYSVEVVMATARVHLGDHEGVEGTLLELAAHPQQGERHRINAALVKLYDDTDRPEMAEPLRQFLQPPVANPEPPTQP